MCPNKIIEDYHKNIKEIEESYLNKIKDNFNLTESNLDKIGKKYKAYLNKVEDKVVQVITQIKKDFSRDLEKEKLKLDDSYQYIKLLTQVYKLAPKDIKTKISKKCLEVFNTSNKEGNTLIMLAAKYGKESLLKNLYKVPDHLTKDSYYTDEEERKVYELCNDSYIVYNKKSKNALMLAIEGKHVSCIKYLISAELIQKLISKRLLECVLKTTDKGKYEILNEFVRVVDEVITRRKNKYHPEEKLEIKIESSFFKSLNNDEVRKTIEILPIKIIRDTQNNFSSLKINSNNAKELYLRRASALKAQNLITKQLQDRSSVQVNSYKRKHIVEKSKSVNERAEKLVTLRKLLAKGTDFNSQQEYEKNFFEIFSTLSNDDKVGFLNCHKVELREVLTTSTFKECLKSHSDQQHNEFSRFHILSFHYSDKMDPSCKKRRIQLDSKKSKITPSTALIPFDLERVNYKILSHV